MSKKKTILLSLVIVLYVIIICGKLFQLGLNIFRINRNTMYVNSDILNSYQEEIKEGLRNADINIPEQSKVISIVYYINWNDDVFLIKYEYKGNIEQIQTYRVATKMPKLVMDNLEKQDKQERINVVNRNIVEFTIILISPIVLYIMYTKKRKQRLQTDCDNS